MGMTRRCWYNGGKATPSCTSCLGAWTNEGLPVGIQPVDISGVCGHSMSVTDVQQAFYAAFNSSAFQITWPASELRVYQADVLSLLTSTGTGKVSLQIGFEDITVPASPTVNYGIVVWDTDTSSGAVYPAIGQGNIASGVAISSETPSFLVGLSGAGKLYIIAEGAYAKHTGTITTSNTQLPLVFLDNTSNTASGSAAVEIKMDAASMTVAVPDMSSDGITAVKYFCGNVVS